MPTSRNAPCPCGSGKKYKKCCMLKEMPPTPVSRLLRQTAAQIPDLLLRYARKSFRKGAVREAWKDFWDGT